MGPPMGTSDRYGWQACAEGGAAELLTFGLGTFVHVPPLHVALEKQGVFEARPLPKHLPGATPPSAPLSTPGCAQFAT